MRTTVQTVRARADCHTRSRVIPCSENGARMRATSFVYGAASSTGPGQNVEFSEKVRFTAYVC